MNLLFGIYLLKLFFIASLDLPLPTPPFEQTVQLHELTVHIGGGTTSSVSPSDKCPSYSPPCVAYTSISSSMAEILLAVLKTFFTVVRWKFVGNFSGLVPLLISQYFASPSP